MKKPEALAALVGAVGTAVIVVHDYTYRRVDTGQGDYDLGGLITHAGADMVILTAILVSVAWGWAKWGQL
jgi:hypothetical protein